MRPTPTLPFALILLVAGCDDPLGRTSRDAPMVDRDAPVFAGDGGGMDAGVGEPDAPGTDAPATVTDAPTEPPLGPPLARPPAGPPDHGYVVAALAMERPDLLAGSCVTMGGTRDFLFEAARRLRAIDRRYGLVMRAGAMLEDRVGYYWGAGAPEGSSETYVVDIIMRHCARPGIDMPPAAGWGDDTAGGGTWTILPLSGMVPDVDAGMPIDAGTPTILPLPDMSDVVDALAAERPDLLAASCVADGGNNEFLFELVRRLRRIDTRWGLNWKRAVIGDMSQDVVDYYYGPGAPYETAFDTYVIDVIGGHCGPSPAPAWIDVTVLGTRGAMWTLAGRTDLGP